MCGSTRHLHHLSVKLHKEFTNVVRSSDTFQQHNSLLASIKRVQLNPFHLLCCAPCNRIASSQTETRHSTHTETHERLNIDWVSNINNNNEKEEIDEMNQLKIDWRRRRRRRRWWCFQFVRCNRLIKHEANASDFRNEHGTIERRVFDTYISNRKNTQPFSSQIKWIFWFE